MITPPVPVAPAAYVPTRTLIVGLALIPLTLVVVANIPALVIMPFVPKGMRYVEMLIRRIAAWSESILKYSQANPRGIA